MSQNRPFETLPTHFIPALLGGPIERLVSEQLESGVATTADETCDAIEAWFKFVGSLLISEYLNTGAPDSRLNRYVFAALKSGKGMFLGQWVAAGRECLESLQSYWAEGNAPTWSGLKNLDFGFPDDLEHPVSRLIAFRNSFSHGSFSQVEKEILEHGLLLETQVALLALDLIERPIYFPLPNGKVAALQGAEPGETCQTLENERPPSNILAYTPYVIIEDGRHSILAPALQIKQNAKDFSLTFGTLNTTLSEAALQAFQSALEIFHLEQRGYVHFEKGSIPNLPNRGIQIEGLEGALMGDRPLTLVQYRPGTGQIQLAASINHTIESTCSVGKPWRIIAEHPGGDPTVFARALMRQSELLLEKAEGDLEIQGGHLLNHVANAARALTVADKTVGYVVLDADKATYPDLNSEISWVDLLKSISFKGSGFRIILLALPSNKQSLPYDGDILMAPAPKTAAVDRSELNDFIKNWISKNGTIGVTALEWILEGGATTPLAWAEITSILSERNGGAPLPPAIEHALWALAPLTERKECEEGLVWYPAGGLNAGYGEAIKHSLSQ